jgi:hypothetical protein
MGALATGGGTTFVMTAGHCGVGTWSSTHFTTGQDHSIGTSSANHRVYGAAGDLQTIPVSAGSFWNIAGWVPESVIWGYATDWTHQGKAWSYVGENTCWTGHTSTGCAIVTDLAWGTYYADGTWVGGLTRALYTTGCVTGGTSGGSVQDGHTILGIVSGNAGCVRMTYNEVLRAQQLWNVSVATTS